MLVWYHKDFDKITMSHIQQNHCTIVILPRHCNIKHIYLVKLVIFIHTHYTLTYTNVKVANTKYRYVCRFFVVVVEGMCHFMFVYV